ncbi:SGNH/GDSL hydrolase family protein [Jiangella aurantiaca]|nr:SGNH/GDSL hydrolase family protein [Jiangella aurantiaca]
MRLPTAPQHAALTAYGHSWVGGAGASAPTTRLVDRTARALGLRVDNRGVSGTASPDTAALIRREPPPPSAAFLIMTGLNDARLHGLSARGTEQYREALAQILTAVTTTAPAAAVVMVEQPHLLDYSGYAPHDQGSDDAVDRYNAILSEVANMFDAAVTARVADWDPGSMLDDDAVHPNDAGHAAVARAATAALSATDELAVIADD